MRCRECGLEVDNDKAFCPVCGAPMKVTADYEYIQAEIANKVDQFFNEDKEAREAQEEEAPSIPPEEPAAEAMAKTKNIYGNDSIFDDEQYPGGDYREESAGQRKNSSDDILDEEEPEEPGPAPDPEDRIPRRDRFRDKKRGKEPRRDKQHAKVVVPYEEKDRTTAKIITVLIIFLIIAAAAVGIMAILGVFGDKDGQPGEGQGQVVSSLTCNVEAGATYAAPVEITINSATEGNVFYTLDGTEPTTVSKIYTGPFTVSAADVPNSYPTVHFRAVSFSVDSEKSGEINMEFELEFNEEDAAMIQEMQTSAAQPETTTTVITVSDPIVTPVSGNYSEDTKILVSSPEGADIFYTYDGTIPTTESARYTGPVDMQPGTQIFSAICVRDGFSSNMVSCSYTLDYGYTYTPEEAIEYVTNELYWDGYTTDQELHTEDGYVKLTHAGAHEIDGYTYYIIKADFYSSTGALESTEYRGVGVNFGNVYFIELDDDGSYYVVW